MIRARALDFVIIPLLLTASFLMLPWSEGSSESVRIQCEDGIYIYPLSQDRTVTVRGPAGNTVGKIESGSVSIIWSDCPNRTCMSGSVSRYPGTLVCLPNRVIVTVEGNGGDVDAASY